MWETSLSLGYHFTDEKIEAQRYEENWPKLTSWPVRELELSKNSLLIPRSFFILAKWYLQIHGELDGEASAFILGRYWVDVCVHGAVDFSILTCTETYLAFPEACLVCNEAVFAPCTPPTPYSDPYIVGTIPLL